VIGDTERTEDDMAENNGNGASRKPRMQRYYEEQVRDRLQ
jgi:hypothetical protein